MKAALFFAAACCGAIACGGHDKPRARAPVETNITTTTSGEQSLTTAPGIEGYAPGESQMRTSSKPGEAVPVPDTSTDVPGDEMTRDGGARY
ncbi:MAG: hypothetical protein JWM74_3351 [Myxococcaceae bacterium]|nr:hypothetical protein [Myxococcaceae bacterium]